jgi:hypothetical protein
MSLDFAMEQEYFASIFERKLSVTTDGTYINLYQLHSAKPTELSYRRT